MTHAQLSHRVDELVRECVCLEAFAIHAEHAGQPALARSHAATRRELMIELSTVRQQLATTPAPTSPRRTRKQTDGGRTG